MSITLDTIYGIQEIFVQGDYHLTLKETNAEIAADLPNIDAIRLTHKQKIKDIAVEYGQIMVTAEISTPIDDVWIDGKVQEAYDYQLANGFLDGTDPDTIEDAVVWQGLMDEYRRFFDEYHPNYSSTDQTYSRFYDSP